MAFQYRDLAQAIIEGKAPRAEELARLALGEGISPQRIYKEALIPSMEVVGRKMQAGEYYLPEVLLSAKAMKAVDRLLKPLLAAGPAPEAVGRVVSGTALGDMHDIGKNLVITMLQGAGFEVVDLGIDVSPEKFIAAIREVRPHIVTMSALLTTTMLRMKDVISSLQASGLRGSVKVMVGGAPVDQRFADEIGADGYAPDAAGAAQLAKLLMDL